MQKFDVVIALEKVAEMRSKWIASKREFDEGINKIMARLLHEAAAQRMSVEEVAAASGLKKIQVRSMMRLHGLDPRDGKTLLAKTAADALASNAELLGVSVHDMDLMSPLAYLPMGKQLQQQLRDKTAPSVHELSDEVSGNPMLVHGINFQDHDIACSISMYDEPVLVSAFWDKVTCEGCRAIAMGT